MINKGDLLTLDDEKEYAVTAVTMYEGVEYMFLMDIKDYNNFIFCSYDKENESVEVVDDMELIQALSTEFDKQLNS